MSPTWTLDFCVHVFSMLFLNPVLATLVPISMLTTMTTIYPTTSLHFRISVIYATVLWVLRGLALMNRRVRQTRDGAVPWSEQVILVTGGASGLGHTLVSMLAIHRGATVLVLDCQDPLDPIEGVSYYRCDVSDETQLAEIATRIHATHPPVTTLVSNAAIMRPGTILAASMHDIDATLSVNLRAQFLLVKAFLPTMLSTSRPGQWITIASSLASVGVAGLGAYCASKAATVSFHESLTAELRHTDIITTLICPGQLDTKLFHGIENPSRFLAPTLSALELAQYIVEKIERGQAGEFALPVYAQYIGFMRILPSSLQLLLRQFSGMDEAVLRKAQTTQS